MSDDELERRVDAHLELVAMQEWCAKNRARLLKKAPPRDTCPGCFVSIYDKARETGWCGHCIGNCKPLRKADRTGQS